MRKYFSKLGFKYFVGTLIVYGVQIIALMILNALSKVYPQLGENYDITFLTTMLPMYIIAIPIMMKLISMVPVSETAARKEKKKMNVGHWFIALIMSYAATYICNYFGLFLTWGIGLVKNGSVTNVMAEISSSVHPLVNLLVVVICAPITEELIFRKLLVDRTVKYGEGVAVVLSALMFGLYHGNLNQFVYAFVLGGFWAFIYVKTRDIRYTMLLHMVINFFGSFFTAFLLELSGYQKIVEGAAITDLTQSEMLGMTALGMYGICMVILIIAGFVLWIVNRKKFVLNAGEETIEKGKRFKTVILNWGMGLFCAFWIVQMIYQLIA